MKKLLITVIAFFAGFNLLSAQTGEEIVAKMLKQRGADAISKIKDWKASGKMINMGIEMPFTLLVKTPNKMRMEVSIEGKKMIQTYNGKEGWMINPNQGGGAMPLDKEQLEKLKNQTNVFQGPLYDYKSKGTTVKLLGREKNINGKDAFKLYVKTKDGYDATLYVDANEYVPLRIVAELKDKDMKKKMEAIVNYSNYKRVDGIMIPHKVESKMQSMVSYVEFEKIQTNTNIKDNLFNRPK
ncbi:MAG: hypothetical protein QG635_230 [Bacteroidota bacterium]|nr:hypothetical protein [Bacteroidota bacterium]